MVLVVLVVVVVVVFGELSFDLMFGCFAVVIDVVVAVAAIGDVVFLVVPIFVGVVGGFVVVLGEIAVTVVRGDDAEDDAIGLLAETDLVDVVAAVPLFLSLSLLLLLLILLLLLLPLLLVLLLLLMLLVLTRLDLSFVFMLLFFAFFRNKE